MSASTCSKAAFARRLGCSRSYIRKLEQAGRLVLAEDGRVDPGASLERIRETAAPGRSGIHERELDGEPVADTDDYRQWRTRREAALAEEAELAYRQAAGELVAVEVVDQIFADRGALLRAKVDQTQDRAAWAAADGTLADALATEVALIMADLEKPLDLPRWQATVDRAPTGEEGGGDAAQADTGTDD